jgi:hypothetical protein
MSNNELRTADQILAMPDNGDFLADFMAEHQKLILALHQAQMDQGGKAKGSFAIKVDYTLDRQLALQIVAEHKFQMPKKPKAAATVWTTADGMLTPQNPKQANLFDIRDATAPATPFRTTV